MAIAYFDSSALVKLLIAEEGSELAMSVWDQADQALSSRFAYPEVRAALAAAVRGGRVATRAHSHALRTWERLWSDIYLVELTAEVAAAGAELAAQHALTGADAVHLASATSLASTSLLFVAWDRRLRTGALDEGLFVVPAL